MGFDLTVHWAQAIGTVASGAAVFAVASAAVAPYFRRRASRKETELKTEIETIVTRVITASDLATKEQTTDIKHDLTEMHGALVAVQTQANATDIVLATQFGGNGNGLRQELNSLSTIVAGLAGRVDGYFTGKGVPSG